MFIKFFKSYQPATLFAIPLVALVFWITTFFHPVTFYTSDTALFYQWICSYLIHLPKIVISLIAIGLLIFQAIYWNKILNNYEVLYKKSYLPSLFYIILMSTFPSFLYLHPLLLVNTILLFILEKIFAIYKNESSIPLDFDIGFLIALASFLYFPVICIFLLHWIALIILRPFKWREWVAGIVGLGVPYFFVATYFFWNNRLQFFLTNQITNHFNYSFGFALPLMTSQIIFLIILFIFFLLALLKLQPNFFKNVIRTRNFQQILLVFIFFGFGLGLFGTEIHLEYFTALAIPLSVFIAYYFLAVKKNWWLETLFFILMGSLLYAHVTG